MRQTTIGRSHGHVRLVRCTGISAVWCPIHGDCRCPRTDDGDFERMDAPECPLHSPGSGHPLRTVAVTGPARQSGHE